MTQIEKDLMWDEMDKHLAYLNGESEIGESYEFSLYYITEMLNGWNFIGERDTAKYTAVLSNTHRLDLETGQAYARDRKAAYDLLNQDEMRFDDQVNGTTTWVDAINAIKAAHPKP